VFVSELLSRVLSPVSPTNFSPARQINRYSTPRYVSETSLLLGNFALGFVFESPPFPFPASVRFFCNRSAVFFPSVSRLLFLDRLLLGCNKIASDGLFPRVNLILAQPDPTSAEMWHCAVRTVVRSMFPLPFLSQEVFSFFPLLSPFSAQSNPPSLYERMTSLRPSLFITTIYYFPTYIVFAEFLIFSSDISDHSPWPAFLSLTGCVWGVTISMGRPPLLPRVFPIAFPLQVKPRFAPWFFNACFFFPFNASL